MKKLACMLLSFVLFAPVLRADPDCCLSFCFSPVALFRNEMPPALYIAPVSFKRFSPAFQTGFSFFPLQQTVPAVNMDYSLPPLPFFCSMENKMQKRFDIWIKFRTGTDADYMKLISDPHKYTH